MVDYADNLIFLYQGYSYNAMKVEFRDLSFCYDDKKELALIAYRESAFQYLLAIVLLVYQMAKAVAAMA